MLSLVPIDLQLTVGSQTASAGREVNEDAVLVTQLAEHEAGAGPGFLLAVADGMGGIRRGRSPVISRSISSTIFLPATGRKTSLRR